MSRIGKKPIAIPKEVTVDLKGRSLSIKGPRGTLRRELPPDVAVEVSASVVQVVRQGEERRFGAFQGMARALIQNMVKGVTEGFKKDMSIVGVGYRVSMQGRNLLFNLGFSGPVEFPLPEGVDAAVGEKGVTFTLKGIDCEKLGQTAATVRGFRPPEPYKGKGIRYANEVVRQKAGKAGAK
ncbi:MAG: 50S ribosomal protein L6 [Deltaproteobacteria bacterium]|nr:50S ribosomal protein L6 [Deltaproteobacteria bacterium]